MEITNSNFIHSVHGTQGLQGPHRAFPAREPAAQRNGSQDEVQFSSEALRLSRTEAEAEAPKSGIRFDLVNRIRSEIAAGTYDTTDKMDAALSKMLSSF